MKPTRVIARRAPSDVARHDTSLHGCNYPLTWRFERSPFTRSESLLVARCMHCSVIGTVCVVIEFSYALGEPQLIEPTDYGAVEDEDESDTDDTCWGAT